jgi:ketosteroid isomerase-like protein
VQRCYHISRRLSEVCGLGRRSGGHNRGTAIAASTFFLLVALPLSAPRANVTPPVVADLGRFEDPTSAAEYDLEDFEAAWRRLDALVFEAVLERDAEGLADCYTRGAQLFPFRLPTMHGRDEVESKAATFWVTGIADVQVSNLEFYEVGDKFCVVGIMSGLDERGNVIGTSRFMSLYKYERGRWRIHREIANY